jgi:hypothetical protein
MASAGAAADASLSVSPTAEGRRSNRLSARVETQVQTAATGGAFCVLRRRLRPNRRGAQARVRHVLTIRRALWVLLCAAMRRRAAARSAQAQAGSADWARAGRSAHAQAGSAAADGAGGGCSRPARRRRARCSSSEAGQQQGHAALAAACAAHPRGAATGCCCLLERRHPQLHERAEHRLAPRRALQRVLWRQHAPRHRKRDARAGRIRLRPAARQQQPQLWRTAAAAAAAAAVHGARAHWVRVPLSDRNCQTRCALARPTALL